MTEDIDPVILMSALRDTAARFPSITVRVRRGLFWYYLEEIEKIPEVKPDTPYPCRVMTSKEASVCAFRVLYYGKRIALEVFHALTDGTGAMTFLKSLTAEYAEQKYGIKVPSTCGILSRREEPSAEEIEDCFPKNSGDVSASRKEEDAYHLTGTKESGGFLHITTGIIDLAQVMAQAKKYSATLTNYLSSLMIYCIARIQEEETEKRLRRKAVKIMIPVNLRRYFESRTVRNFSLYVTVGINPKMGDYSFREVIEAVRHQMGLKLTKKELGAIITSNVRPERSILLRIAPLPLKNLVLKAVYNRVAEKTSCVTISNLGAQELPAELGKYVSHLEFVLGILADTVYNCSAISYGGKLRFTFTSNICEHELERLFFTELVKAGVHVKIENNEKEEPSE